MTQTPSSVDWIHKIAHRFGVRPDIEPAFKKAIEALIAKQVQEARIDELLRLTRMQMIKTNTGTCEQRVVERLAELRAKSKQGEV